MSAGKPSQFQNTNPERGRKRNFFQRVILLTIISEHEPRKGTETIENLHVFHIHFDFRTRTPKGDGNQLCQRRLIRAAVAFQNTNPERGRKLNKRGVQWKVKPLISEHEPRKGTETLLMQRSIFPLRNFRTRTPKGDGNVIHIWMSTRRVVISEHEPRKGTETTHLQFASCVQHQISEHEPRKGTETTKGYNPSQELLQISEHEPRKGTETRRLDRNGANAEHFRTRTPKGDGNTRPKAHSPRRM